MAAERMTPDSPLGEHTPALDPGLTLLETPGPRSTALHHVALQDAMDWAGPIYWLDARNTASTYMLHTIAPDETTVDQLRIARAFTAYQHVSLIERIVNTVSPRTGGLIIPNLASLYRDDDMPDHEAEPLVESVLEALAAVADAYDIPVLVTDAGPADALADQLQAHADQRIQCEQTGMGYRFEGDDVETTVYWQDGAWQTTIPYWVELVGAVDETSGITLDPQTTRFAVEG
jgi:hypothetical protein